MAKHPMQNIVVSPTGTIRFDANKIVAYLLDHGGIDLNALARMDFSDHDRIQFAQLIGYSVSGYGDLPYASKKSVQAADEIAEELLRNRTKAKAPSSSPLQ